MSPNRSLAGAALALAAALGACSQSKDLVNPPPPADKLFASYVSLGNSLTAGFQSGGIDDSTQHEAYPVLLARQMVSPFTIPSLRDPGCPPPIANFLTGQRVNQPTPITPMCSFRSDVDGSAVINNVAVPGANVLDPTSAVGSGPNPLTTLILGGKTQVQRALDAHPTFFSAWIGNNDVLPAALTGLLTLTKATDGSVISPGVTSLKNFTKSYQAMAKGLAAGGVKGGVLLGVVQVSGAPALFPAALLVNNPIYKAQFDALVFGGPGLGSVIIHPSCTPTTRSLISIQIVAQMRAWLADTNSNPALRAGVPPILICEKNQPGFPPPLGDIFVLDGGEQDQLAVDIAGYNAVIDSTATANGWAYFDPNPTLAQLRSDTTVVPLFPRLDQPTKPYGDMISLDGIHPSAATHVLLANLLIDVINTQYHTSLAHVQ